MTVRQLFNEVDEIQCEAIIQQYDYEKNDSYNLHLSVNK